MESTPGETFLIVGTKLDLSEKFLDCLVVFVVLVCLFVCVELRVGRPL